MKTQATLATSRACQWALLLALLALVAMRGLVPPGMMPVGNESGGLAIEICPSSALANLQHAPAAQMAAHHASDMASDMTMHHGAYSPDGHDHDEAASGWDCPFGGLAMQALISDGPPRILATLPALTRANPLAFGLNLGTAAPLPPSTGPPALP